MVMKRQRTFRFDDDEHGSHLKLPCTAVGDLRGIVFVVERTQVCAELRMR
jgi:hypothetical protein